MPNWCEGILKIRGKQEKVLDLLAENLQVWKKLSSMNVCLIYEKKLTKKPSK